MRVVMHPYLDTIEFLKAMLKPSWLRAGIYKRGSYIAVYLSDLTYAFIPGRITIEIDPVITLNVLKEIIIIPTAEARELYLTSLGVCDVYTHK